jgi:hypothetical protein
MSDFYPVRRIYRPVFGFSRVRLQMQAHHLEFYPYPAIKRGIKSAAGDCARDASGSN